MLHKPLPSEIKKKVRKYLARTGKSYREVGERFGLSKSTVSNIINNVQSPRKVKVVKAPKKEPVMCCVFGCGRKLSPYEQLFGHRCINHSSDGSTLLSTNPPDTNTR